jgi:hypothetical protein
MSLPSRFQRECYKGILVQREANQDKRVVYDFEDLMSPVGCNSQGPQVQLFYLKPLFVIAPHELLPHGKNLICNCGKNLTCSGWSEFRYVHSLKSGKYLIQKQYRSHNRCTCEEKSYLGLRALNLGCIPDCLRLMYPLVERYNSIFDLDFVSYVTADALTG